MTEIPKSILTLDQIKQMYPPQSEVFHYDNGGVAEASVCRNPEGKIVYVVPKSTRWINEPPKRRGGDASV